MLLEKCVDNGKEVDDIVDVDVGRGFSFTEFLSYEDGDG